MKDYSYLIRETLEQINELFNEYIGIVSKKENVFVSIESDTFYTEVYAVDNISCNIKIKNKTTTNYPNTINFRIDRPEYKKNLLHFVKDELKSFYYKKGQQMSLFEGERL